MKFYSIAHAGMFKDLSVATYESEAGATARTTSAVAVEIVSTEDDFKAFGGPALVAFYNAVKADGIDPVARFTSKADGARRCFAALEARYQYQAVEAAVPSSDSPTSAATSEEEGADMASKNTKKTKGPKRVRVTGPKEKKERKGYKEKVASTGGERSKTAALEMLGRAKGATPSEIAEKLEVSLGTAKNLIWYLRRDGKKIALGEKSGDRRPYVIG